MRRRERAAAALAGLLAAALLLAGCVDRAPRWAQAAAPTWSTTVALPAPAAAPPVPLDDAIRERRSARSFGAGTVSEAQLAALLWAAQGVTAADGRRAAPSAGRTYPLELYAVTASQVQHYLPGGHRVEVRGSPDLRPRLRAAALGQAAVTAAPLVVVVAVAPARTARRYGGRAGAFVEREVGHATQNLLLEATALGLAAVPIGSVDATRAARVLGLPPDRTVAYLVPVGRPAG